MKHPIFSPVGREINWLIHNNCLMHVSDLSKLQVWFEWLSLRAGFWKVQIMQQITANASPVSKHGFINDSHQRIDCSYLCAFCVKKEKWNKWEKHNSNMTVSTVNIASWKTKQVCESHAIKLLQPSFTVYFFKLFLQNYLQNVAKYVSSQGSNFTSRIRNDETTTCRKDKELR